MKCDNFEDCTKADCAGCENLRLTDSEQIAVNKLKLYLIGLILDFDDEKVLDIIRASVGGLENETD